MKVVVKRARGSVTEVSKHEYLEIEEEDSKDLKGVVDRNERNMREGERGL